MIFTIMAAGETITGAITAVITAGAVITGLSMSITMSLCKTPQVRMSKLGLQKTLRVRMSLRKKLSQVARSLPPQTLTSTFFRPLH